MADEANTPDSGSGLFNGPYSAIGQLLIKPSDRLNLGLTYVHSYNSDNPATGNNIGPFARFDETLFANIGIPQSSVPSSSNSYGVELSWRLDR